MTDPRQDPNWRGEKCKACGERLPFLFDDTCTYCTIEAKDKRIKELEAHLVACSDTCGFQARKIARLRDALERINIMAQDPKNVRILRQSVKRIASEALAAEDTDND